MPVLFQLLSHWKWGRKGSLQLSLWHSSRKQKPSSLHHDKPLWRGSQQEQTDLHWYQDIVSWLAGRAWGINFPEVDLKNKQWWWEHLGFFLGKQGKGKTKGGLAEHACQLVSRRAENVSFASLTISPSTQTKMLEKQKVSEARLITGISVMGGRVDMTSSGCHLPALHSVLIIF